MTKQAPLLRIALVAAFAVLVLVLVPGGLAANGGDGTATGAGARPSKCTRNAPGIAVDNNWQWGSPGSWGLPGQQLKYMVKVVNNDLGCAQSSFVISLSAPSGFSVSIPTSTITLKSTTSGYLTAYVTSPSVIADGDYALTATATRAGSSDSGSFTSYYKVYSSDSVAPTLYWPNPADGQTISGNSYYVTVSSRDDHAVKQIDLYIDNVFMSTTLCEDISYDCSVYYKWSLSGVQHGQHTATFKSYDWLGMGNVAVLTTTFTVS